MLSAGALVVALGVLWAIPRIDQWRGDIEREIGKCYGMRVDIDCIEARWSGIRPKITVHRARVYDLAPGPVQPIATVERLSGDFAW